MSRRSFGRHLAALAAGYLGGQFIKQVAQNKRRSDGGTRKADAPPEEIGLPSKRAQKQDHPTEAEHRTAEQLYWRKSITATWCAVLIAAGAAIFSYKAFQQAQRQADAAERANRPWLRVESATLNSTHTSNGRISLFYSLKIKNSGHEVAGKVFADINQKLSPDPDGIHFKDMTKFICDQTEWPKDYLGLVAFPDNDAFFPVSKVINLPSDKGQRQNYGTELRGCLLYEDARHNRHSTSFSFSLIGMNLDTPFEGWGGVSQWLNPPKSFEVPTYAD